MAKKSLKRQATKNSRLAKKHLKQRALERRRDGEEEKPQASSPVEGEAFLGSFLGSLFGVLAGNSLREMMQGKAPSPSEKVPPTEGSKLVTEVPSDEPIVKGKYGPS